MKRETTGVALIWTIPGSRLWRMLRMLQSSGLLLFSHRQEPVKGVESIDAEERPKKNIGISACACFVVLLPSAAFIPEGVAGLCQR